MTTVKDCPPKSIDVLAPRVPMLIACLALFVAVVTYIKVVEIEDKLDSMGRG